MPVPTGDDSGSNSSNGESWSSQKLNPGWESIMEFGGGGTTFDAQRDVVLPEYYVADLYINNELAAQLDLHFQEGVEE